MLSCYVVIRITLYVYDDRQHNGPKPFKKENNLRLRFICMMIDWMDIIYSEMQSIKYNEKKGFCIFSLVFQITIILYHYNYVSLYFVQIFFYFIFFFIRQCWIYGHLCKPHFCPSHAYWKIMYQSSNKATSKPYSTLLLLKY